MKRGHMKRRQGELLLAIILGLVLTFGLGACGGQNATSAATSEVSAEESSDTTQLDAAALENITVEPAGKPWLNTTWSTSVPAEKPKATDDLYLSVTYDWLKEAKQTGESAAKLLSDTESIKNSLTKAVSDESVKGNGLEQLRIFYQQALDTESLTKQGLEPIKPYTDAIMATKSLDELKDLLVSKDFPFSPWITLGISFADKRETNLAAISPNMLFTKVNLTGGDPYQDSDDPVAQKSAQQALLTGELYASLEAALLVQQGAGDVQVLSSEELQQMVLTMLDFEKSYGKKLDSMSMASKSAYGSLQAETTCTMEELEKAFTNFPIKKLMARYGKDKGDKVVVNDLKWVEPFNALWVDENFEMLRFMTAVKVFNECRTLLDQEPFREVYESLGEVITPEVVAYNACNQLATFSDVVAQNYVENTLGKDAVDRMTKASEDLIATYKDLINNTSWFEDATRSKVLEKLDNMTLNVLYPDGGYYDYSGLKLKTSEEGGTLVSNYLAIKEYRNEQENARIGKPAYANVRGPISPRQRSTASTILPTTPSTSILATLAPQTMPRT